MDKLQEKYKIFERMHKESKQENKTQVTCKNIYQHQPDTNQNYWNHNDLGKSLQDFDMKPFL